jgi:hypothetical protein
MDGLTALGLFAQTAMLLSYALEDGSHWFVLASLERARSLLHMASWSFGLVEAV